MPHTLALIGARGLVGTSVLSIIEERGIAIERLVPVGATRSGSISFRGEEIEVRGIGDVDFASIDVAMLCAGRDAALEHAEAIAATGCRVIDSSSALRTRESIPLVVPELNGDLITDTTRIVSNPNCVAIQVALALAPIRDAFEIDRVDVTTWQAASGAGTELLDRLERDDTPLAANVIPCIGDLDEHGRSGEEVKIEREIPALLGRPELVVAATATRVPVRNGHGAAVHLRTRKPASVQRLQEVLRSSAGLRICDPTTHPEGPTPRIDADGIDDVLVGRIRIDPRDSRDVRLWVTADNLRRGAALNAVMILEKVLGLAGPASNPR